MKLFKNHFLILTLLLGLLIRLTLSPIQGFKFDVDTWFAWAERLNSIGFANFYSDQVWTGYPPGFLYILAILGFIKNIFQIDSTIFYIILKLPSILAEIILALLFYKIIPKKIINWRKIGLLFVILNPAFIFNSAIFGQFDGLFSLTLLLSIYFLNQDKVIYSSFLGGVSFLLKPQAIFLLPVFSFYILKNFSIRNLLRIALPGIILILLLFLPFFLNNFFGGPIKLISSLLGHYPYGSIFAYNFWGVFGFWIPDTNSLLSITYQNWGFLLFITFWIIIGHFYFLKKRKLSLYTLSALSTLSFFFLITRMHERYFYPSLIFLIIVAILRKSYLLLAFTIILTLIYFLDLYYVYIYYNMFYLNLSIPLYNQIIYDFADKNIQFISFVSTFIFMLTSISILKLENENIKA